MAEEGAPGGEGECSEFSGRFIRTRVEGAPGMKEQTTACSAAADFAGGLCPVGRLLQSPEAAVPRLVHAACSQPAAVMPALAAVLQQDEASPWQKVAIYRSLWAMLERGLAVEPAQAFILAASKQLRASLEQTDTKEPVPSSPAFFHRCLEGCYRARLEQLACLRRVSRRRRDTQQEVSQELRSAASNTLVTFARQHFHPIMTELQRQLRPFVEPDEFTLLTLGKLAVSNEDTPVHLGGAAARDGGPPSQAASCAQQRFLLTTVHSCIPFLGLTLATLQTVTRQTEDSRRRRALCAALEQMCQAIRVYLQTWERSSYPRISLQQFSAYLLPLYAHITRTWLPGSDSQVKLAVLKMLGPMLSILLTRAEAQAQVHRDICLLLAQYESGIDTLHITKILVQIMEASLANDHPIPRMQVEPLTRSLVRQICSSGGEKARPQPQCTENVAAISQIFLRLARSHPSELLWVFQRKLEDGREETRVVLLSLLAEIIGARLPELWSKRLLCVKAVKAVLGDERSRVRLATLLTLGKLLWTGYLEKVEGWPLNYISLQLTMSAHQLTHPMGRLWLGGLREKAIERAGAAALHAAIACKRGASQALWLRMLDSVMQPHHAGVATLLCQALRQLAEQRAVRGQDSAEPVNSPTAQQLLARLLAWAVAPLEGSGRGAAALLLLNALRPEFFAHVAQHWWVDVPVLVHYLEGHSHFTLEPAVWESKLLEFLKKSLPRSREADVWNLALGQELATQMHAFHSSSAERAFLCKATGMALSAAGDPPAVTRQLRDLLLHVDYTDEGQRKGACWCVARCAEGQLGAALDALRCFEEETSEGGGLAGQGLPHPEKAHVKSALLLLYSSCTAHVPREQLLPRLAAEVVPKILHHYATAGSPEVRSRPTGTGAGSTVRAAGGLPGTRDPELLLSFAQAVSEVSRSAQGEAGAPAVPLPQKRELLSRILDIIRAESGGVLQSPVLEKAMVALRHLSTVPEALSHEESWQVAEVCVGRTLALPPGGLAESAGEALRARAVAALSELVGTLLAEEGDGRSDRLQRISELLGSWLASEREWERSGAVRLAAHLMTARHRPTGTPPQIPPGQFSRLAAVFAPLTCDPLGATRQGAGDCIAALLRLQGATGPREPKGRAKEWRLRGIQQDLRSDDVREARLASLQLAKVVSGALPSREMAAFLGALLERLRTAGAACDRAALLWFEVAVQERAADLKDKVQDLVVLICSALQRSEDPAQRRGLGKAACLLSERWPKATCTTLLELPLLHRRARRELWAALAVHKSCGARVLKCLLGRVRAERRRSPSCVPAARGCPALTSAPCARGLCLQGLTVLQEAVQALDGGTGRFPLLPELCYSLLRLLSHDPGAEAAAAAPPALEGAEGPGAGPPGPHRQAVAVLQEVLGRAAPEAAQELESGHAWASLMQPGSTLRGVALLARALAHRESPLLDGLLRHLRPSLGSPRAACRELSVAFCVELTGHPLLQEPETLDLLLRRLLAGSCEGSATMRFLSVRGLGNVAEAAPQEVKKHQKAVLAALVRALADAASPEVAEESLRALSRAWGCLERSEAACVAPAVASQARARLQHVDEAVRVVAFRLFGQLARAAQPRRSKPFAEEAGRALAPLLLHLRDPSPSVAEACCEALVSCAPFVGLQELALKVDAELALADVSGTWHTLLMDRACRQLACANPPLLEALLADVPRHLCAAWESVRVAACRLAGVLAETKEGPLDLGQLLQILHALERDPSAAVEKAAAEAARAVQRRQQECRAASAGGQLWRVALPSWLLRRRRRGQRGLGLAARGPH
ncbi:maestro heat-like repeat-containing protein family member 2A [Varanus komodoensis]|uniref:maestro heat-like repeat-containing protein family member 2A n=1 Tax=Varanus komodoensis TaxID=61221 RepID=UPI001CF78865|nr:maestro heat-like repeat-containing protein family member 2A [Varanus komodoensis]